MLMVGRLLYEVNVSVKHTNFSPLNQERFTRPTDN